LRRFRAREFSAADGAAELAVSRSRFYQLSTSYLAAVAARRAHCWSPGASGGQHRRPWPAEVFATLRKLLSAAPPASYGFALDRATVRRFALRENSPRRDRPKNRASQCAAGRPSTSGQLWQYDASPHRWFPGSPRQDSLLELTDDHSRVLPGARIYHHERLLSHFDLLPAVFLEVGLPLALYEDYHSFYFSSVPDALTQLGTALRFYEISLRYAPTPQAKGKIERAHDFWQKRLFAAEHVSTLPEANALLDQLRRPNQRRTRWSRRLGRAAPPRRSPAGFHRHALSPPKPRHLRPPPPSAQTPAPGSPPPPPSSSPIPTLSARFFQV
jgi:hypothetical protein